IAALFAQVGIPATIAELGVPEDRLDEIGQLALSAERLIKNNPRLLDAEGMDRIVRAAHSGDLDLLTATLPRKAAFQLAITIPSRMNSALTRRRCAAICGSTAA